MAWLCLVGSIAFTLTAMILACIAGDTEFPYGILSVLALLVGYQGIRQRGR